MTIKIILEKAKPYGWYAEYEEVVENILSPISLV